MTDARKSLSPEDNAILLDIDLDNPEVKKSLGRMGGHTLLAVRIKQGGKHTNLWVGIRVSGDDRAGKTSGAHVHLEVARRTRCITREIHAAPCFNTETE